jgi:hypothetical protein
MAVVMVIMMGLMPLVAVVVVEHHPSVQAGVVLREVLVEDY